MVDWLVVWGVTQAVGFAFKPILEDLAKDAAKDLTKDFFKDCLKNVLKLPSKKPLDIAAGKALKEFLQMVQQELEDADFDQQQIEQYIIPLNQFIKNKSIAEILGSAFRENCQFLDTRTLAQTWDNLSLLSLPNEFNWEQVAKRYLKKVKSITCESDELRQIFDSQTQAAIAENTKAIVGITADFDLVKYQEGIRERYGNLKLDSLDTSGYAYNELKLWRMFIPQNVREVHEVLPQVHEIPKEHQRRLLKSNQLEAELSQAEWERNKQDYYRQSPRWVFEIWNDKQNSQYVVILGDPGSGKSTLLQYIALEWAESPIKDLPLLPIPLLIELRTYIRNRGQSKDFLEFFHKGSGIICRLDQLQLDERLKAGNAVVMFDGLDEVFEPAKREDIITDIHRFTNDYPQVRVIVTSRIIGYKPQRFRDAGFRHFMLQDLDQYQIDDFIHRWHELTFNDEAEKVRKRDRLQTAINTSSAIRELAGNPLLLTMMAILNRNQELPRDRAELYNQASRVLLHQWDVERALVEDDRLDSTTIDYNDKQAMLRQVAYQMQATEKGLPANLIVANDLEKILSDYLKTIDVSQARTVARLMKEQLRTRNFILCFLGADYYAFVHRTFLEYFCAWEFVWQFKETQSLSIEQLKNEVFGKHYQDDAWREVLRLIAGMIQPKFVVDIIHYLIERNDEQKTFSNLFLAVTVISEVRNPTEISEASARLFQEFQKLTKNESIDDTTRAQGVLAISNTWKNNPEALLLFKDLAQSTTSRSASEEAVKALAGSSKESVEALFHLQTLAQSGNEIAILQLAQVSDDDPNTLKILQTLTQSGNQVAMAELVKVGGHVPSSLPILKTIIRSNVIESIKHTAIGALVRYWKGDPDILPILKKLARSGDKVAIQGLVQNWKDDPETLFIVKTLACSGHKVAIKGLAWNWQDELETLSILKSLARSGNETAAIELLLGWIDDSETLDILRNIVRYDNNEIVQDHDDPDESIILGIFPQFDSSRYSFSLRKTLSKLAADYQNIPLEIILDLVEHDLERIRRARRGIESGHFSTLRTKITNPECLKTALHSLGIRVKTDADVRDYNGRGILCDIVAVLEGNYDIGWSVNSDGSFDMIADLWGVAKKHNQMELINSINQRYGAVVKGYKRFVN